MSYANRKGSSSRMLLVALAGGALAASALACADDVVAPGAGGRRPAALMVYSPEWSAAQRLDLGEPGAAPTFNTAFLEGCPYVSKDGRRLFIASNRPRTPEQVALGAPVDLDIWVAVRHTEQEPWGEPVDVAEINTSANEFCPTLAADGRTFFFVSNRGGAGSCGGDDIYVTRFDEDGTVAPPRNLGCQVNSAGNEAGPFLVNEPGGGLTLYFSSTRAGGYSEEAAGATNGDGDIYMSALHDDVFGAAVLVPGVNSAANEGQPNLRRDAREMFFFSNRPAPGAQGGNDIYSATRARTEDAWGDVANLGPSVNSAASETRPSLSWDGTTLYFGSNRAGSVVGSNGQPSNDIYVVTRRLGLGAGR